MPVYYVICRCGEGYNPQITRHECGMRLRHNAQVSASEAAAVAVHPKTGEVVYCFLNPSDPLPERYAAEGFEKQQFQSLSSLRQFCNQRGLVNDIEYDNPHDGYHEEQLRERERIESQRGESYRRERDLAQRAVNAERGRQR